MTAPSRHDRELMDLLNAVWDERMDEPTRAKIEEALNRDPKSALELLVSYSKMHLDLEWLVSSDAAHEKALHSLRVATKKSTRRTPFNHAKVVALTGIAAAVLVAAFAYWNSGPVGHEHLIRSPLPIGRIARVENATWAEGTAPKVGDQLVEGQTFDIKSGFAQLNMGFGADVLLQGPCRAKILANDRVALERGKLGVRAAKWAAGFQVETDELIATDLGTWFSVQADAGEAEVHVLEGLVLADAAGANKAPQATRRLGAAEAIELTRNGTFQAINFRRDPAAEELRQFAPLRPVKMWNTGVGLKVGTRDPHWEVIAGDAQDGPFPQSAVVGAHHGSYGVNEPERSQWISVDRGTTDGVPARSTYTFETRFDLTGFDLSTVWVSGLVLADDGVDEVRLNGERLDIKPWKDWGYGATYKNFHPIEIRNGFVAGVNRIAFVVKNETYIHRSRHGFDLPETPNPMALRVEWQAFGRPIREQAQN